MSHKGLVEPHILLASNNPQKLMRNLSGVLTRIQIDKIRDAVYVEVRLLFLLGESHFKFAESLHGGDWRQKISRLYYGAYNVKRALSLCHDGSFATDIKDHASIEKLPDGFPNSATYTGKLKNLRDDRNLADYSHLAKESDLVISVADAEFIVGNFIRDAKGFLVGNGVNI